MTHANFSAYKMVAEKVLFSEGGPQEKTGEAKVRGRVGDLTTIDVALLSHVVRLLHGKKCGKKAEGDIT